MTPHPHPADFIEVYHDALDAATCRAIVARFDASRQDRPVAIGSEESCGSPGKVGG